MNKLDKTFKINPLYETDGYKIAHHKMLAPNTSRLYGTWIPRSMKYMHPSITKPMSVGQQFVMRYLHSTFQENFFDIPPSKALKFGEDMAKYIMMPYNDKHIIELHHLGYLPIEVQALPEGVFTEANVPHLTFINTVDGFAWLTLFLETYISKLAWQIATCATLGNKFKKNTVEWVNKTDKENLWLADFMCHDFHARGGNPFTSIAAGLGHAFSNSGGDTLNVIQAARYFYDVPENEVCLNSVNASEHSVSTTKIFTVGEKQMILDWCKEFPTGILSIVADTFDLWKLITEYLADPEVKKAILARNGKLVIRPDSGDPVDITCGIPLDVYFLLETGKELPSDKGVIELLWDIFGGTVNEQGYKVLDSHIGAIYGDSINLERQIAIYERLEKKGFASTNIVLGIGSFSYVFMTRDNMGFAAKGAWFEINNQKLSGISKTGYNIYKDPITDDGTKKSLKGFQFVDSEYNVEGEVSEEKAYSNENMLKTIYKDGKFFNQVTLSQIRETINKSM
jgi:nicotinamide phosphoribosyltransferase